MQKWLLLQMTKMGTTCSNKKEGENEKFLPSFLLSDHAKMTFQVCKNAKKYQNVGQMLPNLGFKTKEKSLTA